MSRGPEAGPGLHDTDPGKGDSRSRIPRLAWGVFSIAVVGGFFMWDFSDIIFARQHREVALELVRPGMRLMKAERELNQQHYTTLYISEPGRPPALDVTTCRRLPWTFQAMRKLFPTWRAPERAADGLLAATHFKIVAGPDGKIRADTDGEPLVVVE